MVTPVADGGPAKHVIHPPYVVVMPDPPVFAADQPVVAISGQGTGWTSAKASVTNPKGEVFVRDSIPASEIEDASWGWALDVPGTWRVRLEDSVAGCVQEFSVDARDG